ncbi:hypothetical protein V511_02140 [Mesotoga sp. Brook.08.YT.4.2.5.1]|nr:hypothetical protein V511_02140 [Mesotoga sp. Brook.08.YT.4.2.5.1]RAO95687.1 hypothetical protein M388_04105 [Mesotoga sp. Brook.08.YT.4.2.5.4.]HAY98827.1 hypothetical protein [Mesotoga sp.]
MRLLRERSRDMLNLVEMIYTKSASLASSFEEICFARIKQGNLFHHAILKEVSYNWLERRVSM